MPRAIQEPASSPRTNCWPWWQDCRGLNYSRPGRRAPKSNTNYVALGSIVEKATGEPLAEVLLERVITPADLERTTLGGTPTARGYAGNTDVTVVDPAYPSAAAGAVSSVADIGRFLDALIGGHLIDPDQVAEMETIRVNVEGTPYGLGLRIRDDLPCGTAYGQIGGNAGYAIRAWTVPGVDRTVVVAITSGDDEAIADKIALVALCDDGT